MEHFLRERPSDVVFLVPASAAISTIWELIQAREPALSNSLFTHNPVRAAASFLVNEAQHPSNHGTFDFVFVRKPYTLVQGDRLSFHRVPD